MTFPLFDLTWSPAHRKELGWRLVRHGACGQCREESGTYPLEEAV